MYAKTVSAIALGVMLCTGGAALAGDGVTVRILNDTPDALSVTIYDRNVRPAQAVVSSEVINGNASLSVSVTADASGRGHLSWTATTVDRACDGAGTRTSRASTTETRSGSAQTAPARDASRTSRIRP